MANNGKYELQGYGKALTPAPRPRPPPVRVDRGSTAAPASSDSACRATALPRGRLGRGVVKAPGHPKHHVLVRFGPILSSLVLFQGSSGPPGPRISRPRPPARRAPAAIGRPDQGWASAWPSSQGNPALSPISCAHSEASVAEKGRGAPFSPLWTSTFGL